MIRDAYEAATGDILVRVAPSYLEDQSDPAKGRYVWAYTVDIENHGSTMVRLISRRWTITDGLNRVEVVEGPGVIGEQPLIGPGETFRYTSGCPLPTDSGAMRGTYRMRDAAGAVFEVSIPAFSLHLPEATRRVN